MSDTYISVESLTPGCRLVHNKQQGVLFGCVSEAVKFLAARQLAGIELLAIILSDTAHVQGVSNWAFEFPVYKHLFMDGGLAAGSRLVIIGTEAQLRRAREIMRITLLGPSAAEYKRWSRKYNVSHRLYAMLDKPAQSFALKGQDGRTLELDELVEFRAFDRSSCCKLNDFQIQKLEQADTFRVSVGASAKLEVTLEFSERPCPPFEVLRTEEVDRPCRLGVRVLAYSNGFDADHGCTAMVLWINGVPLLWDAAPFVEEYLSGYGLSIDQVAGVVISHVHDDHCSLLELLASGQRVRVLTTPEIYESLLIKLAALLDYDLGKDHDRRCLTDGFDFQRLDVDRVCMLYGARLLAHYGVHTIPCIGLRVAVDENGASRSVLITGDTVGPSKLEDLHTQHGISPVWFERMRDLVTGEEDLVIHDGGADPAGLHPDPADPALRELARRMGSRLRFGHRGTKIPDAPEVEVIQPGDRYTVSEGNGASDDLLVLQSTLSSLGVTSQHALFSLWQQGEVSSVSHSQTVCAQGSPPDHFYVVLAGRLEVLIDGRRVAELCRGDLFGEIAIMQDIARTASVRTLSAVRLFAVPKAVFAAFASEHDLAEKFRLLWKHRPVLSQVSVFESLPAETVRTLASRAREIDVDAGTTVITQDAKTTSFYILVDGKVEVLRDGVQVAQLLPNAVIGELTALHPDRARTATVRAVSACRLLKFEGSVLRDLARQFFSVRTAMRLLLQERQLV